MDIAGNFALWVVTGGGSLLLLLVVQMNCYRDPGCHTADKTFLLPRFSRPRSRRSQGNPPI